MRLIKDEGMVILGKANMDEFAMGSSTETSFWGTTRNPWDQERIPGGSSGGSAAAVAAGEAIVALGSDTGGSIRLPACFCGVSGIKPTYGSVSRYGLVAYASSLDQIGPIAWDVTDLAMLLNLICGHDPSDSTSVPRKHPDFTSFLDKSVKGMKLGIPKEFFDQLHDPDVGRVLAEARKVFENLGMDFVELSLPHLDYGIAAYYIIAPSEASSNLARYDGVKYGHRAEKFDSIIDMYCKTRAEGFGDEIKRRIMLGTYALSSGYYDAYYLKAAKIRTLITQDFKNAFEVLRRDTMSHCPYPCIQNRRKSGRSHSDVSNRCLYHSGKYGRLAGYGNSRGIFRTRSADRIPVSGAAFRGGASDPVISRVSERNGSPPEKTFVIGYNHGLRGSHWVGSACPASHRFKGVLLVHNTFWSRT